MPFKISSAMQTNGRMYHFFWRLCHMRSGMDKNQEDCGEAAKSDSEERVTSLSLSEATGDHV